MRESKIAARCQLPGNFCLSIPICLYRRSLLLVIKLITENNIYNMSSLFVHSKYFFVVQVILFLVVRISHTHFFIGSVFNYLILELNIKYKKIIEINIRCKIRYHLHRIFSYFFFTRKLNKIIYPFSSGSLNCMLIQSHTLIFWSKRKLPPVLVSSRNAEYIFLYFFVHWPCHVWQCASKYGDVNYIQMKTFVFHFYFIAV